MHYILHCYTSIGLLQEPMSHLDILPSIAFSLANNNLPSRKKTSLCAPSPSVIHSLEATPSRHECQVCEDKRTTLGCPQCGYLLISARKCYSKANILVLHRCKTNPRQLLALQDLFRIGVGPPTR